MYSQEERDAALAVYQSDGLAAAYRASGASKPSIKRWAERSGIVTYHGEKTQAATEARQVSIDAKRVKLRELLLDKALDMAARMDEPHIDFKGANVTRVTFPKAPAGACQNYATSIAILIDKFRLESGEVTGREAVIHDYFDRTDEDLIREAERILHDAANRR